MAQDQVGGVVGAEAAAGGEHVGPAAAVVVDEGQHVTDDPVLVGLVTARALLQRQVVAHPAAAVEGVHAVDLDPARVHQTAHGVEHAAVLEISAETFLGREHEQRTPPVAIGDDATLATDGRRPEPDVVTPHAHICSSRPARWGSNASRQAIQLCVSRSSSRRTA